MEAGLDDGCGISDGHGDLGGKPGKGVGDAFFLRRPDISAVASIGIQGRANIPAINTMCGPGFASSGFFMDDNVNAGGCNGGPVEIIGAIDLGIGR